MQVCPPIASQFLIGSDIFCRAHGHEKQTQRHIVMTVATANCPLRVLTNLAKWNSLSFPGFIDPLISLSKTIIKWIPEVTNHHSSQFGSFLAELQNILFKEHGEWLHLHQSLCHPTNLRYCYWQLCTHLINSLSFPELTNSLRFSGFSEL